MALRRELRQNRPSTPGKHALSFSKEGFNSGTFPLESTTDDVSGGSVSYELELPRTTPSNFETAPS